MISMQHTLTALSPVFVSKLLKQWPVWLIKAKTFVKSHTFLLFARYLFQNHKFRFLRFDSLKNLSNYHLIFTTISIKK